MEGAGVREEAGNRAEHSLPGTALPFARCVGPNKHRTADQPRWQQACPRIELREEQFKSFDKAHQVPSLLLQATMIYQ